MGNAEAATGGVLYKKVFLKISINSQENTCARVSFLKLLACNFIKKETLAQVSSCEFIEIFKNSVFTKHLWLTAPSNTDRDLRQRKIKGLKNSCERIHC